MIRFICVPLSKDPEGSQFPKYGEVRTIAVTPAIAKLYELCLLQRLTAETELKCPLHPHQRGFRAKLSTEHNLADVFALIETDKAIHRRHRQLKTPVAARPRMLYAFIDLKKAFDKVDRAILIDKLRKKGIDEYLVRAVSDLLTNTQMSVQGEKVPTF
jgi:hypothetical protein